MPAMRDEGGSVPEEQATPASEPPDRISHTVTIRLDPRSVWQMIGAILITMLALWLAGAASRLLVVLAMSFFFSLALQPAVLWLTTKYRWRRGTAVGVIYLIGIAIVVLMLTLLIPALVELAHAISLQASGWITNVALWLEKMFGITISDSATVRAWGDNFSNDVIAWAQGGGLGSVFGIARSGLGLVFDMATIAMFTFYFTADAKRLQNAVLGLVRPENQHRVGWTWDQAVIQTGGYFYSRLVLMTINGLGFFITMVLVGVPATISIPLALIGSFIATFIPAIGSYIGSAVPIALTLGLAGATPALIVLAYAIVYQQIENYWLGPKISARTMPLNGAVAFGAALAGGTIAGPIGAFVALPVAALATALVSNFVNHYEVEYTFAYGEVVVGEESSSEQSDP